MTEQSFNLTREPWIPAILTDNSVVELSLRDVVARAEEVRALTGDVPTQVFVLHRLILAIMHRALEPPRNLEEWVESTKDWADLSSIVDSYLTDLEDRFDLFHPERPFYQVAGLRTLKGDVSGLERLIIDVPNGHPFFTTRLGSGLERISPAEAARWLVHAQAYDPSGIKSGAVGDPRVKGGKGYPIGVAWTGQLGGIQLSGSTLRETLTLNFLVPDEPGVTIATGPDDVPPWEREQLTAAPENVKQAHGTEVPDLVPRGFIDLYTWQSRRVRLVGSVEGVTGVVLANGDRITPQNKQTIEPMSPWRYSAPQTKKLGSKTYMPRELDPSRSFWRGLSALIPEVPGRAQGKDAAPAIMPAILEWAARLRSRAILPADAVVRIRAAGFKYGSNNSVVDEMVSDHLEFPAELLAPGADDLRVLALDAITQTERAVNALARLARNLAEAAGANAGQTDGVGDRAREDAYVRIDEPFRSWLRTLGSGEEPHAALSRWHAAAHRIVASEGIGLIEESGPAAWRGREVGGRLIDVGISEVWFRAALRKELPHAFPPSQERSA